MTRIELKHLLSLAMHTFLCAVLILPFVATVDKLQAAADRIFISFRWSRKEKCGCNRCRLEGFVSYTNDNQIIFHEKLYNGNILPK